MTANTQPESKSPSRRALLAGALGGLGAFAVSAIGRGGRVRAGVDGDVVLGINNVATTATQITNSTNANTVLLGEGSSGIGVLGRSTSNYAVSGVSFQSIGVFGSSDDTVRPGSAGWSRGDSTGVQGYSSSGPGIVVDAKPKTGVYGYANQDSSALGVFGQSGAGSGVRGESVSGIGVVGRATSGTGADAMGMFARSDSPGAPALGARSAGNGTGVLAMSGTANLPAPKARTGVYGYAAQSSTSKGVWGNSPAGHGLHGESSSGWAGYFDGRVLVNKYAELVEIGTPSAPASNHARLFIRDNGSGKTQLCVRFHTGAVKVLATQP
jgi:hypothetical protein